MFFEYSCIVLKIRWVSLSFFFLPHNSSYMVWNNCSFFHFPFCILTFTRLWKLWEYHSQKFANKDVKTVSTINAFCSFSKIMTFQSFRKQEKLHRSQLLTCLSNFLQFAICSEPKSERCCHIFPWAYEALLLLRISPFTSFFMGSIDVSTFNPSDSFYDSSLSN